MKSNTTKHNSSYRPEVDGLRTIAVMAVLIYHAEFSFNNSFFLHGGFLGVDIFFVISGYLITSLIIKEYKQTQKFSILNFYDRRVRRLLPALLIVMFTTLPVAWVYLLPTGFVDFAYSQLASLFFSSNFYWHFNLQDYGADNALLKPFLHTWSLAVEEQFYFFYPIGLLILFRFFRSYTILLLIISVLLSLQFAEMLSARNASLSFYMLPSRFWELASGGVLAFLLTEKRAFLQILSLQKILPSLGLALIIYSFWTIEFGNHHPGYSTIIAIVGTLLTIGFSGHGDIITKLLSSRLFVGIGLISYSLYLWHYPIFAFGRIINEQPELLDISIWFALSFLLAYLSYRFIERPFRNGQLNTKQVYSILLCVSLLVIIACLTIKLKAGFPERLPPIVASASSSIERTTQCFTPEKCVYNPEQDKSIFMLGDSHMMGMETSFLDYAMNHGFTLTTLNRSECQYTPNLDRLDRETGKAHKCSANFQDYRRNNLLNAPPSIVVIGGRLATLLNEDYFDNQEGGRESDIEETFKGGLQQRVLQYKDTPMISKSERVNATINEYQKGILELAEYGHQVVLIYPIPEVGWDVPKHLMKQLRGIPHHKFNEILNETPITTSSEVYHKRQKSSFAVLDEIQHPNIHRVYPHEIFCDSSITKRCITHDQKNLYYKDDDHLSLHGSKLLMKKIQSLQIFQ